MIKRIIILLLASVGIVIAFLLLLAVAQHNPPTKLGMEDVYTLTLTVTGTPPTPTPSRTITTTPTITHTPTITLTPTISQTPTPTQTKLQRPTTPPTRTYTITTFPRALNLYTPDRGEEISKNKITFSWSPEANAVEYTLEIQNLNVVPAILKERLELTYFIFDETLISGDYKWHVIAWDADGKRLSMSQWWKFTYTKP